MDTRPLAFLERFRAGDVCAHPTDTIPGLTADPRNNLAMGRLAQIKGRANGKPLIGLVGSAEAAFGVWLPLPGGWQAALRRLWPGGLSAVWQADKTVLDNLGVHRDSNLLDSKGRICLRVPSLGEADAWMADVLDALDVPLPTTSINVAGRDSLTRRVDLIGFCRSNGVFLSDGIGDKRSDLGGALAQPSTVIEIEDSGEWRILRQGVLSREAIQTAIQHDS